MQTHLPLPRERWVYTTVDVTAAVKDTTAVDGWRPRTPAGPYTGHILEDHSKSGGSSKLQATGEVLEFWNYWSGSSPAGSLIYVRQDPNDGRYKVFGGECA